MNPCDDFSVFYAFFHPLNVKKLQPLHEGSSTYQRKNSVRKVLCDPLVNRPHTNVLTEKDECYVGIHDSQE